MKLNLTGLAIVLFVANTALAAPPDFAGTGKPDSPPGKQDDTDETPVDWRGGFPDLIGAWSGELSMLSSDEEPIVTDQIVFCISQQNGGLFSGWMVSSDATSNLTGYIAKNKRVSATLAAITETVPAGSQDNSITAPTTTALFDGDWSGPKMDGVMRDPNLGSTSTLSLTQVSTEEALDASSCADFLPLDDTESNLTD